MKNNSFIVLLIVTTALFFSCDSQHSKFKSSVMADSIGVMAQKASIDNSQSETNKKMPVELLEQKFLRTATLKFQVKNVQQTSDYIEKKTRQLGGYVNSSSLTSSMLNNDLIPISSDSLLKSTQYALSGNLILRVPDFRLDSLLDDIQTLSIFLDSRIVTADEVSLKTLENELTQQRIHVSNQRLNHYIDHSKNRLRDVQSTDITLDDRSKNSDEALLDNYLLQQQVQYSTVTISISQEPVVLTKIMAKENIILPYEEPFFKKLTGSFSAGFIDLEDITIGISRIWILLGILLVVGFYVKKLLHPVKKA